MHSLLNPINIYICIYKRYTLYGVKYIVCHICVYMAPHNTALML